MGVFRDPRFEEQLRGLQPDLDRLEDALRYVEERVSEDPGSGIESDVPGIYVAPTRLPGEHGLIRVSIFYTYDGQDATFHRLVRAP